MSSHPDIDAARKLLETEQDGLKILTESLDTSFSRALDLLQGVSGRVIVTGMGKSGHVGRKIAATLASTGTPAFFVHPGEASHGDLGMLTEEDGVIALSNSGETPELSDIVAYCRRFDIPLLGVTGGKDSSLSRQARTVLVLPHVPEGCPLGLAPTTSTTMMLALGDALAVALLSRRGFSADDFRLRHPGGKLGKSLLKVGELMHTGAEVPLAGPEAHMDSVLLLMSEKSFGCVGIVEEEKLIGVITDGDLRRNMGEDLLTRSARNVMTPNPRTISPQMLAAEALRRMNTSAITSLFVEENLRPAGILHVHDCLRAGIL